MSRPLSAIDSSDHKALSEALELAVKHGGPAVFPVPSDDHRDTPSSVDSEVALVVETSGSISRPKRVWHTAQSLKAAADQVNERLGVPGVWWQALPSHYVAGVMVIVRALFSGSAVISRKPGETISDRLMQFARQADKDAPGVPQFTSLVPKQLADLVDAARSEPLVAKALTGFSRVLVGGQKVPESLIADARELGVRVTKTYGSAETAGGCVWDGKPLGGTEIGQYQNRVAVAGPMLAGGYLRDPERTAKTFVTREGKRWFISDDRGQFSEGILFISGRADRVIISGGVKVDLDEVEASLQEEYDSLDVAVFSLVDDTWGESIAVVSIQDLNRSALESFLQGRFGAGARLSRLDVVTSLPRLTSGKVDFQELHRLFSGPTMSTGVQ